MIILRLSYSELIICYSFGYRRVVTSFSTESLLTFAFMKKIGIVFISVVCLSSQTVKAQFNTIGQTSKHYKVAKVIEKENPPKQQIIASKDSIAELETKEEKEVAYTPHHYTASFPLENIVVTSPFGYRRDPFTGKSRFHNGLDLQAKNDKIFAMFPGEVKKVGSDSRSGLYVILQHGSFTVSYCHLSKIIAYKGMKVNAGDIVGISGNSGRSTGEHLHLVVKQNGRVFNPTILIDFISKLSPKG